MNNGTYKLAMPANEPVLGYMPGSPERLALTRELEKQSAEIIEIPLIIGGKEVRTGVTKDIVMPHDHQHVIARYHMAGEKELKDALMDNVQRFFMELESVVSSLLLWYDKTENQEMGPGRTVIPAPDRYMKVPGKEEKRTWNICGM